MAALERRALEFGWIERIMMIPTGKTSEDGDDISVNIIKKYGEVSMETIRKYERTYSHQRMRGRQDMHCLYSCLMDTLSSVGRSKVLVDRSKYTLHPKEGMKCRILHTLETYS